MQDRSNNLTQFEFEVTHSCNKNCEHCSHRVATSDYELSMGDYEYVMGQINKKKVPILNKVLIPTELIESVFLVGGEPLCHDNLLNLVWRIKRDFPNALITLQTNGKLISRFYDKLPDIKWVITAYPGWNDIIVGVYGNKPNVRVYRSGGLFWDVSVDPDLSDENAKRVREKCLFVCRVIGRNLYNCCLSEGIERAFNTPPVHTPFTKNWREEIKTIPTWKACKHCFRAATIMKTGGMYGKRT